MISFTYRKKREACTCGRFSLPVEFLEIIEYSPLRTVHLEYSISISIHSFSNSWISMSILPVPPLANCINIVEPEIEKKKKVKSLSIKRFSGKKQRIFLPNAILSFQFNIPVAVYTLTILSFTCHWCL